MRWRLSLFWVLFAPFALVGLGVGGATFAGYFRQRQVTARLVATAAAPKAGRDSSEELADQRQALIQAVALQQQRVQNGDIRDLAALQRGLTESLRLFPKVDGLALANERGDFVHLHRQPNGRFSWRQRQLPDRRLYRYEGDGETFVLKETRTDFDPHRDPPAAPWYAAVKENGDLWRTTVSRAQGYSQPELVLFAPLRDREGRFRGVVSAAVNRKHLSQSLAADLPSPGSRRFVVDAAGQLVATSTGEALATAFAADNFPQPRLAIASADPVVAAIAAQLGQGLGPGTQDWHWQGQNYALYVQDLPDQEQLVVVVPHADFYRLGGAGGWVVLRSLLTLLGTAAVGWALAGYLHRSLRHIEQAVTGFSQNQFEPEVSPNPIAEWQALGAHIQAIGQDLAAAALLRQTYTAELEAAIAERTQKLQTTERFLANLLDRLPGIVRVEDVPTRTLRFVNATHQALANADALACSPKVAAALQQALTLETEILLGDRHGQERWWWVRRQLLRDPDGNPEFLLTIAEDITARRRLEAARQERETQFRNLAENIPSAIFRYVLYSDGREAITYISPRVVHICEIPPQAILNDIGSWWRLVAEYEASSLRAAIAYLQPLQQELWLHVPSGQEKWVEIVAIPFWGDHGEVFWDGLLTDITDRRRNEQALRDSEERYRTLAESLPVGVFRSDAQGQIIYCNQTLQAILGVSTVGLTVDGWMQFVNEQDRATESAGWQAFVEEAQQGRTAPREVECPYRSASGQTGWVWVRVIPERDREGRLVGFLGSVQEITARKTLSEGLDRELSLRRAIEAAMVEGLAVADRQGRQTYVSSALCQMVGWSAFELVGQMPPYPYWAPEDADRIQQILEGHILDCVPVRAGVEMTFRHRDGRRFEVWMLSAPIYNDQGQVEAWLASFYDLTARKALEREREAARDRYQLLFESIHDGFAVLEVVFDAQNQPTDVYFWEANAAFCTFVGQPDLVGRRGSEWSPPAAEADRNWLLWYAQVLQTGESLRVEEEVKFLGKWFEVQIFPVGPRSEPKIGVLARDIDARKRWEAGQMQAKEAAEAASQAKTELLSKITHDLRTPLNAILGFGELLAAEPNLTDLQRSWLQTMGQSGRYLLGLINDMLETVRLRAGKVTLRPETFPLQECLEGAIAMVLPSSTAKGLEFSAELAPGLPPLIHSDRQKLTQILVNLLSNAVKFTPQGQVWFRVNHEENQLCVEVRDTGIGIPENQLAQIFDSFEQAANTQGDGTGLGLAIAQQYTQLMGGVLQATSVLGQGSIFRLRLPVQVPVTSLATPPSNLTKPWLRLLVAEDNPVNQQVMQTMLQRLGYRATFVNNGREALAILMRQSFDLVLMDADMPEMDGITATEEIYRLLPFDRQPPIVGVTALIEQRNRCLRAGMFDVLPKPIRLDDLASALQQCSPRVPLPDPDKA